MDYTCYSLDGGKSRNVDEQVHSTEKTKNETNDEIPASTLSELEKLVKTSIFKTPITIEPSTTRTRLLKHNVLEKWSEENQPLNLSKHRPTDIEKLEKDSRELSSCDPKPVVESSQKTELPYVEPSWSGIPKDAYCFEVLKNGIILSTIDLSEKSFTVFGRLGTSDFVLEHPSVSRYHAIVQYRETEDENNTKGFYIYDLESTHGTFLNKERIEPRTYYRLHVGHMIKFGGSSRMFVLQGPSEDQENESEFTVTELKEMRKQHEEKLKLLQEKEKQKEAEETVEDKGIDWGLGEDAEEDVSTENPFALSTPNEDLYLDDPKKTLRGWFEREGYDLDYEVEEKGFGHFSCKVHLPIDTPTSEYMYAEASVKGKKKEAVAACALEACRILDRCGLLRQAHHESRKRKQKNWEEDDYYDSDEDTYLDRTGTIEKKRDLRKRMFSKEQSVETYESLVKKLQDTEKEIEGITVKLQKNKIQAKKTDGGENEDDELDAYMSSLQSGVVDKKMQSKLQFQLNQMQQEQRRLMKLVEIARPVNLPALEKHSSNTHSEKTSNAKKAHLSRSGISKGSLLKKVKKTPIVQSHVQTKDTVNDDDMVEEEEEEEDDDNEKQPHPVHSSEATREVEMEDSIVQDSNIPKETEKDEPENYEEKETVKSGAISNASSSVIKGPQLPSAEDMSHAGISHQMERKHKKVKKAKEEEKSSAYKADPEYAMWLPPQDQSGDGRTHLNAKFGY